MEEHVLSQMLSGQKSIRTERLRSSTRESPPTMQRRSASAWTPAPAPGPPTVPVREMIITSSAGGLSPVTPVRAPTNTEVSLAEMTSAVVLAAERDRRQSDTIRRLAHQNECLERENRELQDANRDRAQRENRPHRERRRSSSSSSKDLQRELDDLKREKRDWQRRDRARRKEEEEVEKKVKDIERSAKRVLSERDSYLRTIAALSQELHDLRTGKTSVLSAGHDALPSRRLSIPAPPAFSETSHSPRPTRSEHRRLQLDTPTRIIDRKLAKPPEHQHQQEQEQPPAAGATPRSTQSERFNRSRTQVPTTRTGGDSLPLPSTLHSPTAHAEAEEEAVQSRSRSADSEREVTETRRAMHDELDELAAENRKLNTENKQLKAAVGASPLQLALEEVKEELGMLETVVNAIDLSITTDEAKDKQDTMTLIEQTLPQTARTSAGAKLTPQELAERLGNIRKVIAEKYGQYLRDFFTTDESLTLPQGATLPPMPDDTMVSLPTHVANGHEHDLPETAHQLPPAPVPAPAPVDSTRENQDNQSGWDSTLAQAEVQLGVEQLDENDPTLESNTLHAPAETSLVVYSSDVQKWPDVPQNAEQ